jgi:ferredoxin-NADP reductase
LAAVCGSEVVGFAGPVYPEPGGRGYFTGIGVTPAAAMLRSVDEIESRISGHEGRHLILRTTADHGRPSAEDFAALVTDNADYLLCGPAGFMKAAAEALRAAGVLSAHIRFDFDCHVDHLLAWAGGWNAAQLEAMVGHGRAE